MKKKVLSSFCNFSTFPFTIFLLFSVFTLFSLPLFFPVGQQKFPRSEVSGGHSAPPTCYVTDLILPGKVGTWSCTWSPLAGDYMGVRVLNRSRVWVGWSVCWISPFMVSCVVLFTSLSPSLITCNYIVTCSGVWGCLVEGFGWGCGSCFSPFMTCSTPQPDIPLF